MLTFRIRMPGWSVECLVPCYPCAIAGLRSGLPAFTWPSPGCCRHSRSELEMEGFYLLPFPFFQIKFKQIYKQTSSLISAKLKLYNLNENMHAMAANSRVACICKFYCKDNKKTQCNERSLTLWVDALSPSPPWTSGHISERPRCT